MVVRIVSDVAECPEHGEITGLTHVQIANLVGVDAEIEIRAAQLHRLFRRVFDEARRRAFEGSLSVPIEQWVL